MSDSLTENFESSDFEERDFVPFLQKLICSHAREVPLVIVSGGNKYQSTRRPAVSMMRGHQKRGEAEVQHIGKKKGKEMVMDVHSLDACFCGLEENTSGTDSGRAVGQSRSAPLDLLVAPSVTTLT